MKNFIPLCFSASLLTCLILGVAGCSETPDSSTEAVPFGNGPYSVGSTNMEVAPEFANIGDEAMHGNLLGRADESGPRYLADILKHPESAVVIDVPVPDEDSLYGPASGLTLPVVTFVTFPSGSNDRKDSYRFPYHDARYGVFEDMLSPGEAPSFADPDQRYPLIILAHGAEAHGIYDVKHAHKLASHGYIVAVINFGDDRTASAGDPNHHVSFLRPFLTKAVLDSLLESETFGQHVDVDRIGITGHSFGGFTALAAAGAPYQGNTATVNDTRIKAASIAAPWVGGHYDGNDVYAFGHNNGDLSRVDIPVICFFGTKDKLTLASFILPAMTRLSGPTYVIELVGQPHIFERGSWEDRDSWELLFFSAYLKDDPKALDVLRAARSMKGGNEDSQLFDYQRSMSKE